MLLCCCALCVAARPIIFTGSLLKSQAAGPSVRVLSSLEMPLHVATHPLVQHKMTVLRDSNTTPQEFRRVLREITFYLGYEATRTMKTADVEIMTPLMQTTGKRVAENVAIVPILRAGLGMCDAMLDLLPNAAVHHIGEHAALHLAPPPPPPHTHTHTHRPPRSLTHFPQT